MVASYDETLPQVKPVTTKALLKVQSPSKRFALTEAAEYSIQLGGIFTTMQFCGDQLFATETPMNTDIPITHTTVLYFLH